MSFQRQVLADGYTVLRSRSVLSVSAVALALAGVVTAALALSHDSADPVADMTTAYGQGEALIDPITGLLVAALAASYWGGGFRDGSILWSFLPARARHHVAGSAMLVSAALGGAVGTLAVLVKIAALHLSLPASAVASWWHDGHGRTAVAGAVLAATVLAVVGASAALVTRNAAASIAVVFGWMLVVEPLLAGLLPRSVWTYLPAHALSAVRNAVTDVDPVRASVVVLAYTAAAVLIALAVTSSRDPA